MIETAAAELDLLRSRALRWSMAFPVLRALWVDRARRLAFSFVLSTSMALILSLKFSLWVLLLGPLVYGVPHLASSLRYAPYLIGGPAGVEPQDEWLRSGRSLIRWMVTLLAAVAAYRLAITLDLWGVAPVPLSEWSGSSTIEAIVMMAMIFVASHVYRVSLSRGLVALSLAMPILWALQIDPVRTVGVIALAHNFVGFAYWFLAARNTRERGVAIVAAVVTSVLTALLWTGALESRLLADASPSLVEGWAGLSYESIGRLISPDSLDLTAWRRIAAAFAFSQSIHYFIWLKAIPDQFHHHPVTTSFRQSLSLLRRDFGWIAGTGAVALSLASLGVWIWLGLPRSRLVYFAVASFHGYVEVGALLVGVALFRRSSLATANESSSRRNDRAVLSSQSGPASRNPRSCLAGGARTGGPGHHRRPGVVGFAHANPLLRKPG